MIGYTPAEKFKYWLFQDKIPLTKVLMLSNLIAFLAIFIFKQIYLVDLFSFSTALLIRMPWTAFTYPLVWAVADPISLLFAGYWLWVAGGSLERSWSTLRFSLFFFSMCAISALGLFAGVRLLSLLNIHIEPIYLFNLWLPLAGLTVAFAMLNPEQQIMFMFVIPLKLKYLAMISAGLVLIQYGMTHPLLGLFALAGCAFSYWHVRPTRYSAPAQKHQTEVVRVFGKRSIWQRLNPFAWIKEWNDKRKLKKFFDKSDFRD